MTVLTTDNKCMYSLTAIHKMHVYVFLVHCEKTNSHHFHDPLRTGQVLVHPKVLERVPSATVYYSNQRKEEERTNEESQCVLS